MLSRNQEQEKIMLAIYQYLFYKRMNQEDLVQILENVFEVPYNEVPLFSKEVSLQNQSYQRLRILSSTGDKLNNCLMVISFIYFYYVLVLIYLFSDNSSYSCCQDSRK